MLLPLFARRLDAGENSEFSCRFVERHKTDANELTLQTIWHAATGTRSKTVVRIFLIVHPDDARGVVRSIEANCRERRIDPVAARRCSPQSADVRFEPGAVPRRRESHRRRETTARFVASLVPRRRELFELAVHRPPRRLHPVDSGSKPSERCDQPPPHARGPFDRPIHVYFRIRNVNRSLYFHEAPFPGSSPWRSSAPAPRPRVLEERKCYAIK